MNHKILIYYLEKGEVTDIMFGDFNTLKKHTKFSNFDNDNNESYWIDNLYTFMFNKQLC